ncbi:MAG: hypothetical protein HYS41_00280 [Candidatus Omnitrophica bacterium]|nr:hypothetical protein [Candidatus Omnitrophota bacterium]
MAQLLVYLVSVGLVVLGALGFIAALSIPGKVRSVLACLAACVPITIGVWLFRSAGLKLTDLSGLLKSTTADFQNLTRDLKETQSFRRQFKDILK